jgi:hypothetical protein
MIYTWTEIKNEDEFISKLIEDTKSNKIFWFLEKFDIWKDVYVVFITVPKTKKYLKIEFTKSKYSESYSNFVSTRFHISEDYEIPFYIIYNEKLKELEYLVESRTKKEILSI